MVLFVIKQVSIKTISSYSTIIYKFIMLCHGKNIFLYLHKTSFHARCRQLFRLWHRNRPFIQTQDNWKLPQMYYGKIYTSLFRIHATKLIKRNTGNTTAASIPVFRLLLNILDTMPVSEGPAEHPRSPPRASSANITVPPLRSAADALLKLPGHIIPTERPHIAQPARFNTGEGTSDITRYEIIHSTLLPAINLSRSILSPYFP